MNILSYIEAHQTDKFDQHESQIKNDVLGFHQSNADSGKPT